MFSSNCLQEIFEARVEEYPNKIAVSTINEQISYGELNLRANQLAHRLQTLGVGADILVGLCVDRSIEMIVGLLAILKAGGAYVPIDPHYPSKRISFLLDDSTVSVVVTVSRAREYLEGAKAKIMSIDDDASLFSQEPVTNPLAKNSDRHLAYVIYTSGSTGIPKGVLVEHHNVVRLFEQTDHWFGFNNQDVWTMFHSISFDFSVWEIWGALLYGGQLVIVPFEVTRSPQEFHHLLQSKGVTILNQTPSAFRQLIAADLASEEATDLALRLVIFGGEALELKMLKPWIERYGDRHPKLVNMYGITETTIHVTYRQISKQDLENVDFSPIGIPIPDLEIYLLDSSRQPVAEGTPGELYIAGSGLARGYLNRPELTAERFVLTSISEGIITRLYYSGDRAFRLANGDLVYLGRSDEQIKVRGFRIEPREIEFCLGRHPQIIATVVVPHDYGEGDVRLLAYIVPTPELELTAQLTEELSSDLAQCAADELPTHMRPSAYMFLSELPLTAHGKINRNALPLPVTAHIAPHQTSLVPKTSTEQVLTEIWEEVLELKGIETNDDFFASGGTSLALIRIFNRVNEHFELCLDISAVIEGATIAHFASCIDAEICHGQS